MGILITSTDGRVRICVPTSSAADPHIKRLRDLGTAFEVTDLSNDLRSMSELDRRLVAALSPCRRTA